jgi:hemerythrin-like domain-containing protein
MRPSGVLMIEHRLIERIIPVILKKTGDSAAGRPVEADFVETAVDVFKTYADRTHHGKEEDILFKALEKKELSPELSHIMNELINEHVYARKTVANLVDANARYRAADKNALHYINENLKILAKFYPGHIEKEDRVFFPETMKYFTDDELDAMLAEFRDFDSKMIHEKYQKVIESLTA